MANAADWGVPVGIGTSDVVSAIAWIAFIACVAWQTTRKTPSAARAGGRGRRLRTRPANGSMSVRFTPPPRYQPDAEPSHNPSPDGVATAAVGLAPERLGDDEGVYEYGHLRGDQGVNLRTHIEEERGMDLADYLDRSANVGYTVVRRRVIVVTDWEVVPKGSGP